MTVKQPGASRRVQNGIRNRYKGKSLQKRYIAGEINQAKRDRGLIRSTLKKRRPKLTAAQRAGRAKRQQKALAKYEGTTWRAAGL